MITDPSVEQRPAQASRTAVIRRAGILVDLGSQRLTPNKCFTGRWTLRTLYAIPAKSGDDTKMVLEKMAAIQMVDLFIPTTDGRAVILSRYTEPEADQAILLRRLKMSLPAQPPPRVTAADVSK